MKAIKVLLAFIAIALTMVFVAGIDTWYYLIFVK